MCFHGMLLSRLEWTAVQAFNRPSAARLRGTMRRDIIWWSYR
jgi:hypothetical protein